MKALAFPLGAEIKGVGATVITTEVVGDTNTRVDMNIPRVLVLLPTRIHCKVLMVLLSYWNYIWQSLGSIHLFS